jgi:integrase
VKANSASATLNKWLKAALDRPKTCHEFRHTMRDRLRHAGAPRDVIDSVGGWSKDSVGENYGLGHALKTKADFLGRAYASLTG